MRERPHRSADDDLELDFELLPEPDFLPPRLEAPGEVVIFAARDLNGPCS